MLFLVPRRRLFGGYMRVAIIADDLTGAADTGAQLARAGYRTAVAFRGAPIPPAEDLDAVALDTDSRAMPAGFAAKRVMEAGHTVRHARIVYKKLDSTLRGPIAAELSAALGASGRDRAVVAPAFPAAGRTTADGVQLVRGVPVHETEAKNDPRTPVREGHVPTLLADAFPSVVSLSAEDLTDPDAVRRALEEARCVVADAARDEDLEALVQAVPDPSEVLWAGSPGSNCVPWRSTGARRRPCPVGLARKVRRWGRRGRRCRGERARPCTPRRTGSYPAPGMWWGRWLRSWALSPGRGSSTRWCSPGGTRRSGWRGGWARWGYGWRGRWRLASRWELL